MAKLSKLINTFFLILIRLIVKGAWGGTVVDCGDSPCVCGAREALCLSACWASLEDLVLTPWPCAVTRERVDTRTSTILGF